MVSEACTTGSSALSHRAFGTSSGSSISAAFFGPLAGTFGRAISVTLRSGALVSYVAVLIAVEAEGTALAVPTGLPSILVPSGASGASTAATAASATSSSVSRASFVMPFCGATGVNLITKFC